MCNTGMRECRKCYFPIELKQPLCACSKAIRDRQLFKFECKYSKINEDLIFMGQQEVSPYIQTTRDIRVSVLPEFLPRSSDFESNQLVFAYHISIENLGSEIVQLIERHWKIFSDSKLIGEVIGPGVVGEQPILAEGQSFEYSSSTIIHHPHGYMEGIYKFKGMDNKLFDVSIPRFYLICPELMQ